MNTSKQVNVMVGLLMVFLVATLLYFLWDSVRADDASERQLRDNAARGGRLFSVNCRLCHGITGKGALERAGLPGAILNIEDNRPTDPTKLREKEQRFRDTIRCGRVGTLMPYWSQSQGGPLNDFQIEQLVILMTSAASEEGWEVAIEEANYGDRRATHGDEFEPPKHLAAAVGGSETTLRLSDVSEIAVDDLLRIDDEPTDEVYEIVQVKSVSEADSTIEVERGASGTEALEHAESTEVFKALPQPAEGPIVGESGIPPCGQRAVAPAPSPAAPIEVSGSADVSMGDNFFELGGTRNPTLAVKVGDSVTVSLSNGGANIHNMRVAGIDNEYETDDDDVSDPDIMPGGSQGTLTFTFAEPGTFSYQCDFHITEMKGEIVVVE